LRTIQLGVEYVRAARAATLIAVRVGHTRERRVVRATRDFGRATIGLLTVCAHSAVSAHRTARDALLVAGVLVRPRRTRTGIADQTSVLGWGQGVDSGRAVDRGGDDAGSVQSRKVGDTPATEQGRGQRKEGEKDRKIQLCQLLTKSSQRAVSAPAGSERRTSSAGTPAMGRGHRPRSALGRLRVSSSD